MLSVNSRRKSQNRFAEIVTSKKASSQKQQQHLKYLNTVLYSISCLYDKKVPWSTV